MTRYRFFDVTVDLQVPADLQSGWNLLYGQFAVDDSRPADIRITCSGMNAPLQVDIGGHGHSVANGNHLQQLQEVVQSFALPAVRSHVLWHGAAWVVNQRVVVILGESGSGKTTLSMAERQEGGMVLSDEIAAWSVEPGAIVPFPRALAVLPSTLQLLADDNPYPRLAIDEEKVIVELPIPEPGASYPLAGICCMEWGEDGEADPFTGSVCEFRVPADVTDWEQAFRNDFNTVELTPHPDGQGWWRCRWRSTFSVQALEPWLRSRGVALLGYHRGARRRPQYTSAPRSMPLDADAAVRLVLPELINGRAWADREGPARLIALVRGIVKNVACIRCVPGTVQDTRAVIHSLVS